MPVISTGVEKSLFSSGNGERTRKLPGRSRTTPFEIPDTTRGSPDVTPGVGTVGPA